MQTRRDHVQAYQFFTGRLSTALTAGDPGGGDIPLRRSALGGVFGLIAAALLLAGFAVYGLISPGENSTWRAPGAIVVEKETGNRYLYINGTLHPTLNLASAMLYYANGGGHVVDVSRNSLTGVPHGRAIGIPDAPDSMPSTLLSGAWSRCATSDGARLTVNLDPAVPTTDLAAQRVLVADSTGRDYLIWRDIAYPVGSRAALISLGVGNVEPVRVTASWLAALHIGAVLAAPSIPGAGTPGPVIAGRPSTVGQLLALTGGAQTQYYVLRQDGIAPVSATVLALFQGQPGEPATRQIGPAALAGLPTSSRPSTMDSLPDLVGARIYQPHNAALCVRQTSSGSTVSAGSLVAEPISTVDASGAAAVPADAGMYAYALPMATNAQPTLYLITDQGRKFQLTQQAPTALGLGGNAVGVPASVLAATPSGPTLVTGSSILSGR